ncbi:MAG: hypothetical protein WCT08_04965 [Patescibacteria group bacterium]|jgi:hypothetical protein
MSRRKKGNRKDADTPVKNLVMILKLFPKSEKRSRLVRNFVNLCFNYYFWYQVNEGQLDGINIPESGKRRKEIHDQIMEIIAKLFLQPDAEKVFGGPVPDRFMVRQIIVEHCQKYGKKRKAKPAEPLT